MVLTRCSRQYLLGTGRAGTSVFVSVILTNLFFSFSSGGVGDQQVQSVEHTGSASAPAVLKQLSPASDCFWKWWQMLFCLLTFSFCGVSLISYLLVPRSPRFPYEWFILLFGLSVPEDFCVEHSNLLFFVFVFLLSHFYSPVERFWWLIRLFFFVEQNKRPFLICWTVSSLFAGLLKSVDQSIVTKRSEWTVKHTASTLQPGGFAWTTWSAA